jgi:hypothetical protein
MGKPSERIKELCRKVCASHGKHQPSTRDIDNALPYAIVEYLDEQHSEEVPQVSEQNSSEK